MTESRRGFLSLLGLASAGAGAVAAGLVSVSPDAAASQEVKPGAVQFFRGQVHDFLTHVDPGHTHALPSHMHTLTLTEIPSHSHSFPGRHTTGVLRPVEFVQTRIYSGKVWVPLYSDEGQAIVASLAA